ncbi:MAG: hypothetical protein J5594_02265 [Elusimicrobiaceae bacterium]|nr:hypothetical protein [Elusimicrobiaceae bacterium]
MQTTWNFFVFLGKLPYLFALVVMAYIFIKALKAFWEHCSCTEEPLLKGIYNFFDPYHQSIFCYKYKWYTILLLIGVIYLVCKIYIPPELPESPKGLTFPSNLFCNCITYFFNYLVHENLGHNTFCKFTNDWFCSFSGNFIETLVPCVIYMFSLQLRGGMFFSPVLLYWLSSTFYEAGIYASDAAVNKLALTSADMVSDFAAGGSVKGDWYYILGPFDAIEYGETIGMIFEIIACIIFVLAIYSFVEYIIRLSRTGITHDFNKLGER